MNRTRLGIIRLMAMAAATCLAISPPLAGQGQGGCPDINGIGSRVQSPLVGASFSVSGNTASYVFNSWVNESPVDGVPGLIDYCIYPGSPPLLPANATAIAVGANGSPFKVTFASDSFSFGRDGGNPSNIPLNGGGLDTMMGTAEWSATPPSNQTILLHINDAAECDRLYGGNPGTCFVLPSPKPPENPPIPPTVLKNATPSFDRTYTWGIEKAVDKTTIDIPSGGSATFNYTIHVTHDNGTDSNWQVSGNIVVTNPNSEKLTHVVVTDAVDNAGTCTVTGGSDATLPPGATTFPYTCTYSSAPDPPTGKNTATIVWPGQELSNGTLAAGNAIYEAVFDFSTATPTVKDGSVAVTDPNAPDPPLPATVQYTDPSPTTFTYPHTFTGDPGGTCTSHSNTATFTTNDSKTTGSSTQNVTVCVGLDLTVSKTAIPSFQRTYKWGIAKDVDKTQINEPLGGSATFNYTVNVTHDNGTDSDWKVTGVITLTNPNDWEAVTANVTDAVNNGGTCTVTGGTGVLVPAKGSVSLPYSCTYSVAPSPLAGTNTATATWDGAASFTPSGSNTGSASFDFGSTSPTIVDGSVSVTDPNAPNPPLPATVTHSDPSPTTFTYSRTFTGDPGGTCTIHSNTATFTTNTTGATGSASQHPKVCVGLDLTVSKTAFPFFTRTYLWSIGKAVDKTRVEQIGGGTATFNYTVNAGETGFVDSAWHVTGTIVLHNPNDWEAITANVADQVNNGGTCSVTGGAGVVVPAGGTAQLSYGCTYASAPSAASGINSAIATWDPTVYFTPSGTGAGSASFVFGVPTSTVNQTITVTDTFNGGAPTTLGTLTATDLPPYASATFTYSRTVTVPTWDCVSYTNTVVIVETGQNASQTVTVCGPARTGALTMGFWQNKNGQGIITGGASTGGVCNSGTWLRLYAPFDDLNPTATCSQVGIYVTTVIKAANASGASMNAMLKAQMLATSLDVYFSDPALGGNMISARAPIGGVSIDLTWINKPIGSGTFENTSLAFGGATCPNTTVLQLLTYASSQSNAGGSVWYGQLKSTQELAKDTFDAINNQVAFACP